MGLPGTGKTLLAKAVAGEASSASMATLIDLEVQRLLSEGYQMAQMALSEHHDQLNRLALALMEREQLVGA